MTTSWEIEVTCEEVWKLSSMLDHVDCMFIQRCLNKIVYSLARFSICLLKEIAWEKFFPSWVVCDAKVHLNPIVVDAIIRSVQSRWKNFMNLTSFMLDAKHTLTLLFSFYIYRVSGEPCGCHGTPSALDWSPAPLVRSRGESSSWR